MYFQKRGFDTVFYLAVHQHLEAKHKGSGDMLLDEIIGLEPQFIAVRGGATHTEHLQQKLQVTYGTMCFYGSFTRIAPLMVYRRRSDS